MIQEPGVTTPRLIDSFIELMGYVQSFHLAVAKNQPPYEQVRTEILRLLKQSDQFVEKGYGSSEEHDQARYAVCAWIDEKVLGSTWNFKGRWRPELLQRVFYRSADAGDQFFRRLNGLAAHEKGIREVYYLCLALGFKGRYCAPDDVDSLNLLKKRNLVLLFNGAFESPSIASLEQETLFPEAYFRKPQIRSSRAPFRRWAWSTVFAAPALVLVVLFLIYRFTLFSLGAAILKGVAL